MNELVTWSGDRALTNSLLVAERFSKRHDNVLRNIQDIECSEEFSALNFEAAEYLDNQRKPRKMFNMTKDGFLMLAMGFTGKEAATWREKFINLFNQLEKANLLTIQEAALIRSEITVVKEALTQRINNVAASLMKHTWPKATATEQIHYSRRSLFPKECMRVMNIRDAFFPRFAVSTVSKWLNHIDHASMYYNLEKDGNVFKVKAWKAEGLKEAHDKLMSEAQYLQSTNARDCYFHKDIGIFRIKRIINNNQETMNIK